jgi:glucan phosphoethanolaminetransferase (alkaline phosphatase superfamily)
MNPIVPSTINKPKDLILAQLLFGGLIFVGLFMKFLSGFMPVGSSIGEATITIWGYSIILFSLLGLIIIQIDPNTGDSLKEFSQIPFTVYILALIVLWIIILNIKYTKPINQGTIPPTYSFWNKWSNIFIGIITILILLQIYAKISKEDTNTWGVEYSTTIEFLNKEQSTINVYLGFILFLNVLITGIQTTILNNFRVDG